MMDPPDPFIRDSQETVFVTYLQYRFYCGSVVAEKDYETAGAEFERRFEVKYGYHKIAEGWRIGNC